MKKGLVVLPILVFCAVILSYYSVIMNRKLVDVSRYPGHVIYPTSHASQNTVQREATDSYATVFGWQITQATLKTIATQSTRTSTQSAGLTTFTDGSTKMPQDSTQTTTMVNTDIPAPPGSSTSTPSTDWSSTPMAQTTMAAWSTASHTTLGMGPITTPPDNKTSLTTSGTTAPAKGKTTRDASITTTQHLTATISSSMTTVGPTLVPQSSSPPTGTYLVYSGSRACMKADMGVQLLIQDKKMYQSSQMYFNLNPNVTQASGSCGPQRSNLLLTFPGGSVNLTFVKAKQSYHIEMVAASLTISALAKVYSGLKGGLTMFETKVGHSFKCISEQSLQLSSHLQVHTVNVQLQAFDFDGEHFGNVIECTSDYTIVIPVIVVIVIPLCILVLVFCGIRLRRKSLGYQRI
ncbi:lysosome-associated membrane glycoprotein 3 isoform X2 [Phascolarctos cinereus]|uniref:Lysosome-associated membrane glycoprotein 3 n=1 Tax=Phascolarctos cinereus TaxID=38626 RepID=A0A6P5JSZ4_PHACI|nr:lysosome-associated membrane glycoprotein 3 isoform X2 [Phascolarctos cinereus]